MKTKGRTLPPVPRDRRYAVVSVRLSADEFDQIALYAERHGLKTSTFIKEAALGKSRPGVEITRVQAPYPVSITATNLKND